MPSNFLEQLVSEWLEYQGYYVRRNARVGFSDGKFAGELDVVAFKPPGRFVHVETSMAARSKDEWNKKMAKSVAVANQHAHSLFPGMKLPRKIEHKVLVGAKNARPEIDGAESVHLTELINTIGQDLVQKPPEREAVPEQFVILRALQYAVHYWKPEPNALRGRQSGKQSSRLNS